MEAHPSPYVVARLRHIARTVAILALLVPSTAPAQQDSLIVGRGDSVMVHLVDVDLRAAVQALSRHMDRPVVFSGAAGTRVTLETPRPVPRGDIPRLLRGLLESQNMELFADTAAGIYRLRTRDQGPQNRTPGAPPPGTGMAHSSLELFVIHLRHAKAADVSATINALYGRASAFGEIGAANRPTLARDLTESQVPPGGDPSPTIAGVATGRPAALSGETTIVPDVSTNSLLIRASRADFGLIQAAVSEVDVRPLQVLIEVVIAEVRRDRVLDFGVEWNVARRPASTIPGSPTIEGSTLGGGLGDMVLKVMGIGRTDINATLRAGASRGDVNILSRPVLLAANNERAEINVGTQRPFVQVQRVLPTDNTARDQVVQYKDVGTRLQLVPTISSDGYVMLQVVQEINAATAEQQFNAPVISTRSIDTKLLVKDGQTIVLGGLIDRQREASQSGIPVLSSLPVIGGLFGRARFDRRQTELFLFLTPRVISRDEDASRMTHDYEKRVRLVP